MMLLIEITAVLVYFYFSCVLESDFECVKIEEEAVQKCDENRCF